MQIRGQLQLSTSPRAGGSAVHPRLRAADMTAFIPPVAPRAALPSRRPFSSRLRPRSARIASVPRAQLSPDSPQQDQQQQLQPITPNNISSPAGFSLRDVPSFNFQELSTNSESLAITGVYAIRGPDRSIMYMGYSKNVAAKLQFHQTLQPQNCVSFHVYVPPLPPELISPDLLESVLEYWVRETGTVPRGNTVDRALWENPNPIPRKVLLASIFLLFFISSLFKQGMFFATRY